MQSSRAKNRATPVKSPQVSNSLSKAPSFSPFVTSFLEVQTRYGFCYGAVWYCQRQDLIIACPLNDDTMQFYDANTLLPLKQRKTHQLDGSVMQMSFHPETDTYIIGCLDGSIYMYNASSHKLKKLKKCPNQTLKVTFVNWPFYAYSVYESNQLSIGNIKNDNVLIFDSPRSDRFDLYQLSKSPLLFSSLINGSVLIYRTDKLPQMPVIGRFQGDRTRGNAALPQSFMMNGKEYVATTAQDEEIKIWHVVKGRMRLVKVIRTERRISSFVYLENYKMIAAVFRSNEMEFYKVPSGRLERRLELETSDAESIFLKGKDMLGVLSFHQSVVEFVQL